MLGSSPNLRCTSACVVPSICTHIARATGWQTGSHQCSARHHKPHHIAWRHISWPPHPPPPTEDIAGSATCAHWDVRNKAPALAHWLMKVGLATQLHTRPDLGKQRLPGWLELEMALALAVDVSVAVAVAVGEHYSPGILDRNVSWQRGQWHWRWQ